ncbi:NADP-dependent oxidoreductase [Paraferrimonas haliotis]|uniref:NADP-dependent oxidoreductase n=1 Tax=Paraferrimonas haliotis TaxID=2013866 RepID=A0AA37TLN0_9GAMM|nr:NADP-dependent oxidoreductase [Paraferrimonas haliotis]GLS83429.1 NADP-dependent oxidoreductase [Paraferrimonas haliotis]
MSYQAIVLKAYPEAHINQDTFEVVSRPEEPLKSDEFRIAVSHLSLDPAMRGWVSPDPNSYIPPVQIGEVMRAIGVGTVTESNHPKFPVGARVTGITGWTEQLLSNGTGMTVLPEGVSAELALSALGMPGMTAYIGYKDILEAKPNQTIVVTGAAGAVGSVVVQMAVADGLNVVGVAGSDDKCDWLTQLGCQGVINYKTDNVAEKLLALTPNGVDLMFENTGGEVQHHVIERINPHGRVAVCGLIADYHSATPAPAPSWINLIKRRARIEGFTITDHYHRGAEITQGLLGYLQQGKLEHKVHTLNGLESAIDGVNLLFSGANTGKLIVEL